MKLRKKPDPKVADRRNQKKQVADEKLSEYMDKAAEHGPVHFAAFAPRLLRWEQVHYGIFWL